VALFDRTIYRDIHILIGQSIIERMLMQLNSFL
jgi:hypothetical protein